MHLSCWPPILAGNNLRQSLLANGHVALDAFQIALLIPLPAAQAGLNNRALVNTGMLALIAVGSEPEETMLD
jgi:hypothetical protein